MLVLAIRCAAHVFATTAKRTFDLYSDLREDASAFTEQEVALIDRAKFVIDTAQTVANNVRGMRKVRKNCSAFSHPNYLGN